MDSHRPLKNEVHKELGKGNAFTIVVGTKVLDTAFDKVKEDIAFPPTMKYKIGA